MRKIMYALVLFALATPLLAKDPFAGTWKLNSEKSKYTAGSPAKEVTLVIEEQHGGKVQVTVTGTRADGSPLSVKYTIPTKGGKGTVETGDFDGIDANMVGTHTRELRYTKDGKELRTRRMVLSQDRKTMKSTVNGTNAIGKQVAGVDVFDRH